MNRRGFLQLASLAPVAAVAAPVVGRIAAAQGALASMTQPVPGIPVWGTPATFVDVPPSGSPMTPAGIELMRRKQLDYMRREIAYLEAEFGIRADDYDGDNA